ncbi:acylphosphatase [Marininema mesophilum]|uniref:Acylphosphatase n=1 Tax=Marininema mesophilum TaxID=1048340 RepID=A0A1H2ZJB9_9BACL|nr:acylphosphatase [Marininema mesophilum]SDX17553.1 acylphosphatase [Marininema mesophilum]
MQRRHLIVHGHVQGVGFRWFTQRTALRLKIYGWVRNRADGTVEIDAQGETQAMKRFVKKIHQGNIRSKVVQLDEQIKSITDEFYTFEVR